MVLNLSNEELAELLAVLNVALIDSTDMTQRANIRKWIRRLSQPIGSESKPSIGIDAADAEAQVRQDWSNDE